MTNKEPIKVVIVGISFQIKYPKIIPKIKAKYLRGVTNDTSDNLYDWLKSKFATPPKIPTNDNNIKSLKVGKTQPKGRVRIPSIVIDAEK